MKKILFPAALFFLFVVLLAFGSGTPKDPKEVSEYSIAEGNSTADLEFEVKNMIYRGYQPAGGVSFSNGRYVQAMTR